VLDKPTACWIWLTEDRDETWPTLPARASKYHLFSLPKATPHSSEVVERGPTQHRTCLQLSTVRDDRPPPITNQVIAAMKSSPQRSLLKMAAWSTKAPQGQ